MGDARSFPELTAALRRAEVMAMVAGDEGAALHRCEQYLQGLLKGDEQMLLAWPVLSVNEWGKEQRRVLVLTSQGLYRMQYDEQRASVDRYTAVSLGRIRRIERAVQGYRLILAQPDGRENPVNYLYDLFANHASSKEAQYDRMYLPRVTGGAGVAAEQGNLAAAIELTVAAIANANRLLVASVGKHVRVEQLKVVPCVFKPGLFKPNWINQEGARRLSGKFKALLS